MEKLITLKGKVDYLFSKKQNLIFALGIIFVAIFWRVYRINQIPQAFSADEAELVRFFIQLTQNGWQIDPSYIYFALYSYLQATIGYFTGFSEVTLRLVQAALGSLGVVVFYQLVKNWFNRQTALLAGLLFATSSFHVLLSRGIEPLILTPLFIMLVLLTFTSALRTNKLIYFIALGFLGGLTFYIDPVFIFWPVIITVSVVYIYYKNKKLLTGYWRGLVTALLVFLVVGLPYIYFLPRNFKQIISLFNPGSIGDFYLNLGGNIQSLFFVAPIEPNFNVGVEPILDPFVTIAFVCGFVYALFYLRRKKFLILTNWFIFGLVVTSLYKTQSLLFFIFLLPAVYTIASIMLDYVLTHWVRTFPFNKAARLLMTIIFSTFLFMSIFYNYQKYFWAWGRNETIQNNFQETIDYQR